MTRDQHRRRVGLLHRQLQTRYAPQFNTELKKQYRAFIDYARKYGIEAARHSIDSIVTMEGVANVSKRLYRTAGYMEGNRVLSSLKQAGYREKRMGADPEFSIGFDSIAGVVDEYFKLFLFNRSAIPITETTKRYIRDHLLAEIDAGKPYEEALSDFSELAISGTATQSAASKTRAQMIALTETTRALSFGGLVGAYMSGVDVDKVWVTSNDERVRGARWPARYPHTELDGQTTSLLGSFQNGQPIKFPGDPDASAANTINCRCSNFYKEKDRPKPRVAGRQITRFLTDFFLGFLTGQAINELLDVNDGL